ncbi:MAG: LLM class F420-dependent oxidoreductase [Actinomycetota bacterium]|nr:LLM class F420-dependent oxidoreductase [Actinomycetota bacterium]
MRYGIKTAPQHCTWQDMLDIWRLADDIELFESAWNFDHFYPLVGDTDGPCMEAWVTLSALAQATSRIRVGAMVNGIHYRHPAVVANMAASLDIVSAGRLDLGLGAGWHEEESAAYGIRLGGLKERFDRFDEGVEVVVKMLSQETTDFHGEFFQIASARCEPKGPQVPHPPIVIGGGGEKRTLRTVARWAQHWNLPFATPESFVQKNEVLMGHCATVGRDESEITRSVQIALHADADPAEAAGEAAALFEAGVEVVIYTMRTPYSVSIVEALAAELART